ncbi:MAG: sugar transferase [Oscillospiraceae bacterium]|nr:sugar transferase [Oscillospiraceae bacterium]MCM0708223.1 sugar transferase [Faecalicatena sp. BF-R-105]MDY3218636.1 sugar transferase [Candidatus Fimivivens sp.]SFJ37941.1 Sugar transferase involved in LPS biosynthesis (colanic, teichoic acid) [Ruminococcaceae bacterium D5]GKH50911.1 glycosyl transferase [Eubacteriales bacterium]
MLPRRFAELPVEMQNESVSPYFELLSAKRRQLFFRRAAELPLALFLLALLLPLMGFIAAAVCFDSPGGAIYRQTRVTALGRRFTIYKFRTMRFSPGDGGQLAGSGDSRITRMGRLLRRLRLDELPQLWNIVRGEMSFVGPRPELPRFIERYDRAALATLLLPAGLTGPASLAFAGEERYLDTDESERVYADLILPRKNAVNLAYIASFSIWLDLKILFQTLCYLFSGGNSEKQ